MPENNQSSEIEQCVSNGHTCHTSETVLPKWERAAKQLDDAIEEDSAAIGRLLQACGSSRDFGLDQLRTFEKLIRHRRRLITRLERLRRS